MYYPERRKRGIDDDGNINDNDDDDDDDYEVFMQGVRWKPV